MALYLVFATSDLSAAVASSCTSYYLPFSHLALISHEGSPDALARRLGLDRSDGRGPWIRAVRLAPRSFGVLT